MHLDSSNSVSERIQNLLLHSFGPSGRMKHLRYPLAIKALDKKKKREKKKIKGTNVIFEPMKKILVVKQMRSLLT